MFSINSPPSADPPSLEVDLDTNGESQRKRRAIRACAACRLSKVKCNGERPCARCTRNNVTCQYFEAVKDAATQRLENIEADIADLKERLDHAVEGNLSFSSTMMQQPVNINNNNTGMHRQQHQTASPSQPDVISISEASNSVSNMPISYLPPLRTAQRFHLPQVSSTVDRGLFTWQQAAIWFQSFFSGSHVFVPVFDDKIDTAQSVASRSPFLFDAIISIGCRAEEGPRSTNYQRFQPQLREHLSKTSVQLGTGPTIETIQAIAIVASYSENGWIFIAVAIRLALELQLPEAVDLLIERIAGKSQGHDADYSTTNGFNGQEKELYRFARVWYGVLNLEYIFALDGGRPPSIDMQTSSRRIRALANHPERTLVDIRLFSQIELNNIRSTAYESLSQSNITAESEAMLREVTRNASIDLNFWFDEWSSIASLASTDAHQRSLNLLNLQIQHAWALITLHLKAVADTGIDNIALMTTFQHDMVRTAKDAATKHLELFLRASSTPSTTRIQTPSISNLASSVPHAEPGEAAERYSSYLATFKWTMDFVWAKCAFSILLVLKLALLLRDPPEHLMALLRDAHAVLEELKRVTVGQIAYFQILQTGIEKCECALKEYMTQQADPARVDTEAAPGESAESEFQGYAPREFQFEWDFPGLNLRHVPLRWQDLFLDFDNSSLRQDAKASKITKPFDNIVSTSIGALKEELETVAHLKAQTSGTVKRSLCFGTHRDPDDIHIFIRIDDTP